MKPYLRLWWRLHRGLLDPEIAEALSTEQVQGMYLDTLYEERMIPVWKRPHWYVGALCCVIFVVAVAGPFRFAGPWVGHPCIGFVIVYGAAGLCMLCTWWFLRRAHARAIYRSARFYGFDICMECGYWLRGLREAEERCPECGKLRIPMPKEKPK